MSSLVTDMLSALFFFAPAGIANTAPVWFKQIPGLKKFDQPLDHHKTYRGKRILGDHKTYRGLLSGGATGAAVGVLQLVFINNFEWFRQFSVAEGQVNIVLLGMIIGFGALIGDAVKSFAKRQIGVSPGKSWFPFDQADFIIGGLAFSYLFVDIPARIAFFVVVFYLVFHPFFSYLAYMLKLKSDPF